MNPMSHETRENLKVIISLAFFSFLSAGCGLGHMQSARPTPKGHLDVSAHFGYVHNEVIRMRAEDDPSEMAKSSRSVANFPINLNARYGVRDDLDIGLKLFLAGGFATDVKYNFIQPSSPLAVSFLGGVGTAAQLWAPKGSWVLNIPLSIMASYDVASWLTPYAALGYNTFWVFGREKTSEEVEYQNKWKGHGDGLVVMNAGFEIKFSDEFYFTAEYNYWRPVLDDPGDYFRFAPSHIVMFGLTIRARVSSSARRVGTAPPPLRPAEVSPSPQPPPPPPPPPPRPLPQVPTDDPLDDVSEDQETDGPDI